MNFEFQNARLVQCSFSSEHIDFKIQTSSALQFFHHYTVFIFCIGNEISILHQSYNAKNEPVHALFGRYNLLSK